LSGLVAYLDRHPGVGAAGPMLRLADESIQVECARHLPRLGNLWQWLLLLDKLEWAVRHRKRAADGRGDPPRGSLLDSLNLLAWPRLRTCAVESICGACMVVRSEVVKSVGMLDEASPLYLDDIDYCRRILDAGWPIHYVAESQVTHLGGKSSGQLLRAGDLYALQCHAIWLYLRKHEGALAAAAFVAIVAFASMVRGILCLAALALVWGRGRDFWLRQRAMVAGLARWSWRWPRRAPRFGFASEAA
jgi:N-acetylglucosaminyl-diphospho-decaprenol L-rhamnosyltransferase